MGKVANMPPQNLKYVMHCRQRRTEPQPQLTRTEIFIKFGRVVFEICEWTDRQTDRQTDMFITVFLYRHQNIHD